MNLGTQANSPPSRPTAKCPSTQNDRGPAGERCKSRARYFIDGPEHRQLTFQVLEHLVSLSPPTPLALLTDLLFLIGSVQTVNPGRMRNQLFPTGQATYIPRGAAPKLLERPRDVSVQLYLT